MTEGRDGPVVTLDGPAGSGKSSTAKEVARILGFRHLDSGALYRALTFALLDQGVPVDRWPELSQEQLDGLAVDVQPSEEGFTVWIAGRQVEAELRTDDVTRNVSHLAQLPAVRSSLLDLQRRAGSRGKLVADGRDMGTVVFPDADVKVYLVADVGERARRRLREHSGPDVDETRVPDQIAALDERDQRDSERDASPLRKPDGAHEIDTTGLDFAHQVQEVVDLVRRLTTS